MELENITGVNKALAQKLRDIGILDADALANADAEQIAQKCEKVSEDTAEKVIKNALIAVSGRSYKTGNEVMERRKTVGRIRFEVPELDEILGGGVETQCITEFFGEFGSGKTQLTHQLAVNVQLPVEFGGLDGSCLYIDSENSFRPNRLEQMIEGLRKRTGLDINTQEYLDNVRIATAPTSTKQMALADAAEDLILQTAENGGKPVKLIVVDSLTSNFRAEYFGRENLVARQQALYKHMKRLQKLAEDYNLAAVVTNQVVAMPDAMLFSDPTKPIGGHIVGHTSKVRCYVRKSKKGSRVIKVIDAPDLPIAEAPCSVTVDGIVPLT